MLAVCLSLLCVVPTNQAYASDASNVVEIGYWAQPHTTIEKGEAVQTGDRADLSQYFLLLSLSTFSLFLVLLFYRKKEREENNYKEECKL